jgi:hypothetical protein
VPASGGVLASGGVPAPGVEDEAPLVQAVRLSASAVARRTLAERPATIRDSPIFHGLSGAIARERRVWVGACVIT